MDKNELISALKKLDDYELVQVLAPVLSEREPYKNEPDAANSKMFLGIYAKDTYEDEDYVCAIAYPFDDQLGPDWGFCQSSASAVKDVEYVSNCKQCVSPFDGREIYLT
jgi:predicted amidophosphoribosyltransferase